MKIPNFVYYMNTPFFYHYFPIPLHSKLNMEELENNTVFRDTYNLEQV